MSVILVDVSSFSTFQKFLVFSLILFLILIIIKTGQKILSNNITSEDENTHSMLNAFRKGRDGNIDVVVHVADIFLSVLIASILTAACIYLFAVEFAGGSLYLLFILSVFMGLILFWLFDFVAGILSYVMVRNAKKPAFLMLFFMFIIVLSYPFRKLFERSLRQEKIIRRNTLTFSDLSDVIESSEARPEEEQEKELMKGVLNFSDLEVKEIMRSRVDVIAFPAIMKFSDVLKEVVESGYSRFPVYKDNLDNITGILHIKDLLPYLHESEDFNWQKFIRSAMFVPENLKINQLLKQFQSQKNHLAVIVDEYGGTAGIVTLEDIIEEIVGEIDDEFDEATDGIMYEKISEDEFVFDGKTSLNDFCKITAYPFDKLEDVKGDAETLAGLILSIEGKFPEANSLITFDSIQFHVVAMDNRRIQQVKVKITTDNENKN
jgi:gliding motility-associated protein GldE